VPTIYSNLLNADMNWTDQEYAAGKKYLKWEEVTLKWEDVDLTWDEVFILLEVFRRKGGGGGGLYRDEYEKNNPWKKMAKDFGEENTKKVIKLYCRVRGVEYEDIREPMEDVKVTVNEFTRFINEVKVKVGI
jgi:hypothetical protein